MYIYIYILTHIYTSKKYIDLVLPKMQIGYSLDYLFLLEMILQSNPQVLFEAQFCGLNVIVKVWVLFNFASYTVSFFELNDMLLNCLVLADSIM